MENQWNVYHGVCVEDKVHNSRILKIYIRELLPFLSGELGDNDGSEGYSYIDDESGDVVTSEIVTSNHITAEWLGLDTNRTFPPDVVRGEQVLAIKYSDEDLYYWIPMGRDDNLRRLELLRTSISDDTAVDKKLDDDNTYYIEMDTKYHKRIRIVTAKSDGEDFKYEIVIDAKNNFLSLSDDIGNEVIIESDIPRVKLKNSNGTLLDLNKDDAIMLAPRDVVISAERQIVMHGTNITMDAHEAIKSTAPNVGVKSSHMSIDSGTTGITGNLQVMIDILTTQMSAINYNTGGPGSPMPTVEINVGSGTGSTNTPSPLPGSGDGARHCSAEEQVLQMATLIKTMFDRIHGHEGIDLSGREDIPTLALASKMPKNKGE